MLRFFMPWLFMDIGDPGWTKPLTRHKKQEQMRKCPDSFDENGDFNGEPCRG